MITIKISNICKLTYSAGIYWIAVIKIHLGTAIKDCKQLSYFIIHLYTPPKKKKLFLKYLSDSH
ncbi:hypothetical protein HZS_2173 [Henneguya salminicola]|nr:hypothetical protein HZS_2173 [Henneguya salminicola]